MDIEIWVGRLIFSFLIDNGIELKTFGSSQIFFSVDLRRERFEI